ncbi:MAG: YeeE/YedE family protein [Ahrensia sp.]|nr:YeeE/YedE family protein [Ahrensia sp.]
MEELAAGTVAALGGLLGGVWLGFAARWGRFCTLKAIEDSALGADSSGLRMWGLAIAVAAAGTYALDHAGLINIANSFYLMSPATIMATIAGGAIFGLGMALVGTCGFGTLARVGGGDLKSVVTFLVMGITAYATLRGATAYLRLALFDTPQRVEAPASMAYSLASYAALSPHVAAYAIAVLIAFVCLLSSSFRQDRKKIVVGCLVGLTIVWGWVSTGIIAADEFEPYPLESFTFSAPLGETIIYAMTMSGSYLKFGIGAVAGVVIGAALTSLSQGQFRWEACDDAREMRRQILGGVFMGFGGVVALGCTVGQGLSAASMLAWSAPAALVSIYVGAWLGLHYLVGGSLMGPIRSLLSVRQ